MVRTCSVPKCTVRWKIGGYNEFYRLPKDPSLREEWVKAIRKEPTPHTTVCGNHFTADDYTINEHGKEVLKKGAVPSVFNFSEKFDLHLMFPKLEPFCQVVEEDTLEDDDVQIIDDSSDDSEKEQMEEEHIIIEVVNDNDKFEEVLVPGSGPGLGPFNFKTEVSDLEQELHLGKENRRICRDTPCNIENFVESDLKCPKKRRLYWKISQETIRNYRTKQTMLHLNIRRKNKEIQQLKSLLADSRFKKLKTVSGDVFMIK